MLRLTVAAVILSVCSANNLERKWDFMQPRPVQAQAPAQNKPESAFPAWYHMPKQQVAQHAPAYGNYDRRGENSVYDRQSAQQMNAGSFSGYPAFGRQPAKGFGQDRSEMAPVQSRRSSTIQDGSGETSLQKYHKLLLKKRKDMNMRAMLRRKSTTSSSTASTTPSTTRPDTTPKIFTVKPIVARTITVPVSLRPKSVSKVSIGTLPQRTVRPIVKQIRNRLKLTKVTPTAGPETTTWTTPDSFPIETEKSTKRTRPTVASTTTATSTTSTTTTTTPPRARFICVHKTDSPDPNDQTKRPIIGPFRPVSTTEAIPTTTTLDTTTSTEEKPDVVTSRLLPLDFNLFNLLWPNAELFAAIRDVVTKFKASLDETGLDQDVKHMSKQLHNTWNQLRTGPMNEQLSQMFAQARSLQDSVKEEKKP